MAATAICLQLRRNRSNSLIGNLNFFSSSSIPEPPNNVQEETTPPSPKPQSSFSSYFSDVKSSLRQRQEQQQQRSPFQPSNHFPQFSKPTPTPTPTANPSKISSFDEIRKNLSEFRSRTAVPPPSGTASQSSLPRASPSISFQELYKKNVMAKGDVPPDTGDRGKKSFDMIRESLKQLGPTTPDRNDLPNRSKLTQSLFGSPRSTPVFGGTDSLPQKVFGKESNKKAGAESAEMKSRFVKSYTYGELGERLRMLRPEEANKKTEKWFSLKELSERLMKLREIDEKMPASSTFSELRESLFKLHTQDEAAKTKKSSFHRIDVLGQLGGTPDYMLSPPKEHLLEKYFHPDNMSSAEKMKIELKKVRDEFKMSESDCGSARVQVAQLTTKIKHLSTTLHKKDKHSRKGLQAMVQQRKKLLKYLRRTDWDSYCLVLDKLGLRDNPDYKN